MLRSIVLGGGCFWCTEAAFRAVPGVQSANPGYANGHTSNPTYEQVCTGSTGHNEVIQVVYDPEQAPLSLLLRLFFKVHDPTTLNRQGNDTGTQYRSGIYFSSEDEREAAIAAKDEAQARWPVPIVTEIVPLTKFWPAEEYHVRYFEKNPGNGYCRAVIPPKLKKVQEELKAKA